jgi:pimeloyl-ACP methyl ester carboxylesterase
MTPIEFAQNRIPSRKDQEATTMEQKITFQSDGLKLAGIISTPADLKPGERRPVFIVLHGFGGNKDGQGQIVVARQFNEWGYVTLRIDFRGCGESEGEHGRIICLDQVADTRNAISYMAARSEVDPQRIGLVGSSFGAAVAVFTGGADQRVAAVISCGGWGDGERKFRGQHPTPEAWAKFTTMLEEGRRLRERTGKSLMVPRYDIVPIPEKLRGNMSAGSIMEFPAETAQSMNDFRADDQVGNISPRPLLLLHSANDSVTPTYESIEMFKRARQPAELHLLSDVDHFTFNEENPRLTRIVADWLERYFPVHKK